MAENEDKTTIKRLEDELDDEKGWSDHLQATVDTLADDNYNLKQKVAKLEKSTANLEDKFDIVTEACGRKSDPSTRVSTRLHLCYS